MTSTKTALIQGTEAKIRDVLCTTLEFDYLDPDFTWGNYDPENKQRLKNPKMLLTNKKTGIRNRDFAGEYGAVSQKKWLVGADTHSLRVEAAMDGKFYLGYTLTTIDAIKDALNGTGDIYAKTEFFAVNNDIIDVVLNIDGTGTFTLTQSDGYVKQKSEFSLNEAAGQDVRLWVGSIVDNSVQLILRDRENPVLLQASSDGKLVLPDKVSGGLEVSSADGVITDQLGKENAFATIKEAVDAGKRHIVVRIDTEITSPITLQNDVDIFIHSGRTVTANTGELTVISGPSFNLSIRGGGILVNGASRFYGGKNVTIDRIYIENTTLCTATEECTIQHCKITNSAGSSISGGTSTNISYCDFDSTATTPNVEIITLSDGIIRIVNNTFSPAVNMNTGSGNGKLLVSGNTFKASGEDFNITQNGAESIIDGNYWASDIKLVVTNTVTEFNFINNHTFGSPGNLTIKTRYFRQSKISGNSIINNFTILKDSSPGQFWFDNEFSNNYVGGSFTFDTQGNELAFSRSVFNNNVVDELFSITSVGIFTNSFINCNFIGNNTQSFSLTANSNTDSNMNKSVISGNVCDNDMTIDVNSMSSTIITDNRTNNIVINSATFVRSVEISSNFSADILVTSDLEQFVAYNSNKCLSIEASCSAGGNNVLFSNNYITDDAKNGIRLFGTGNFSETIISNNECYGGINLESTGELKDFVVEGNNCQSKGMVITGSTLINNMIISNNTLLLLDVNTNTPINTLSVCDNIIVDDGGLTIRNQSTLESMALNGNIAVDSSAGVNIKLLNQGQLTKSTIVGNVLGAAGLIVDSTGTIEYMTISGNTVSGSVSAMEFKNQTSMQNMTINGNVVNSALLMTGQTSLSNSVISGNILSTATFSGHTTFNRISIGTNVIDTLTGPTATNTIVSGNSIANPVVGLAGATIVNNV